MLEKTEEAPMQSRSPSASDELFTSDEFRLYCFKVLPCSKRFVHDWPSCPFAHPGEKAKRRDPRTHHYDCEMCPAVVKGEACELGAACPHSHHVFESWLHPQKYRTLLCKDGDQCHREVCFFAHGSKQLRTPERGHQRAHQRYAHGPEPARKQQAQPANSAAHPSRHAQSSSAQQQQQQQQQAVNRPDGSAMACMPVPADGQLQEGFAACDPRMSMLQPQLLNGACANGDSSGLLPACGTNPLGSGDMMQLLQTLAAEVSATRHEAAEHSRVAAAAQQKLQLLEQLLGCPLPTNSTYGCGYGSVSAGPSTVCTPLTSPVASNWAAGPLAAGQQVPSAAPAVSHLLTMQQLAAQGVYDSACLRRHSLDEALLRRGTNLPSWRGNAGRSATLWNASPSAMVSSLAAVTEGMALSVPPGSAAAADAAALGAVLAAARGQGVDGCFSGMPAVGLVSGSSLMSPSSAAHSNWMGGMQAPDSTSQVWSQPDLAWAGAVGQGGVFNSATQLPRIPQTAQGLNGGSSISAPQVQADYLAQMHAVMQNGGSAMSLGMLPGPRQPERASFDTAAAYLPSLPPMDLHAAGSQHTSAGAVTAELAGGFNSGNHHTSGSSSMQDAPAVLPDTLATNPIGGAHQLGWF